MTIKRTEKGWQVDIRPLGVHGPRVRKTLPTKAEAMRYEAHVIGEASADKGWNNREDNRRLADLINAWFESHGLTLKDGERRLRRLHQTAAELGNPVARLLKPEQYTKYRTSRLKKGLSPKTLNNELTYVNAVFNELYRTDIVEFPNPLGKLRPIKLDQKELAYLDHEEIQELLNTIEHKDALLVTKICLATGARWGEAQGLYSRHVRDGRITFTDTKSGQNRSIPISNELEAEIKAHGKGELFGWSLSAFRRALAKTTIQLPKGQAAHVLRHTFASHFIMNGGNILTLQRLLGHSTINMTMRYAHLAPDHLNDAVRLNPLFHKTKHPE